ncbi:MAG: pentapeptide repeat-containing protein [Cyanobacteria bacterium P01_D01_bin.6]
MNLQNVDLSGADLSYTNIHGTCFVNANLKETLLRQTEAGLQNRYLLGQLLASFFLAILASFTTVFVNALFVGIFLYPGLDGNPTLLPGFLMLMVMVGMLLSVAYQGVTLQALNTVVGLLTFTVLFAIALAARFIALGEVATSEYAAALVVSVAGAVVSVGNPLAAIAVATIITVAGAVSGVNVALGIVVGIVITDFIGIILGAFFVADFGIVSRVPEVSVAGASLLTIAGAILSGYVAWQALKNEDRFSTVRVFALAIGAVGGTSFSGADLTGAYFAQATLKNTNFANSRQRLTNLTHVRWHNAKKLNCARVGNSILRNPRVRDLVVTLDGAGKNFSVSLLRGANLAGANLVGANFFGAVLSDATLTDANLQEVNLAEASCVGTDFSRANFTGATLEAWNIESTTKLDGAHCDYVYLLRNQQERRPHSGIFGPGEFTKLFQEVLDTIDLIFRNGVDWRAFLQTLNQVQQKYEDADLAIQSIENKGDGVVVAKLNAAPGADKPAIHESFTEIYQRAFKEAEAQYKAQLHAKDSEIQIYRQQSADMVEILKLQAQRPIINQATAESRTMQEGDRSISIGGDATGSVFQTGNENTASLTFQPVTLPPPESVNIQAELLALRSLLASLNDPVTDGFAQKLESEAQKPEPDRDVVGQTLETGLTYAKNLQGFAETMDKLRPHVQNAAGWLGQHWYKILSLVGLAAL